jgi:predicted 3-demethylubiquinone-9 3-methyltransferase (glyoxalase superfamily)
VLLELPRQQDTTRGQRVMHAMLQMNKLDIAALEKAAA